MTLPELEAQTKAIEEETFEHMIQWWLEHNPSVKDSPELRAIARFMYTQGVNTGVRMCAKLYEVHSKGLAEQMLRLLRDE